MNFLFNPWIDPRVAQIRMAQIETYLFRHGWRESNKKKTPMRAFRDEQENGVFLPGEEGEEFLRYAIDAVACLARAENRYAGDVLTDVLSQPAHAMNPTVPVAAERNESLAPAGNR